MLGSSTEADDAVQEAWLRLNRSDTGTIENLGGWLTTVVARVALDALRRRQTRRENLVGSWLPEPIVTLIDAQTPEDDAVLADSVGLALLVVLNSLAPAERVAFVLHDMFAVPFDEIGRIIDRTPAASRQLASRARRRVRGVEPGADTDPAHQRKLVDAFLAAARDGDFQGLVAILDRDVVFRVNRGGDPGRALEEVVGREAVAQNIVTNSYRVLATAARPAIVNGAAGLLIAPRGRPVAVVGFAIRDDRITQINLLADPAKLRAVAR
jgi:RNA polymerase sigma-70 factor (ECF subfamily)